MYSIYLDGQLIYTPGSEDLTVTEPQLSLELNSPGEFTFTLPNSHPYFESVQKMLSRVEVYRDDEMIFCGRVTGENIDFWKNKALTCEGELGFLNDSIQRPAEYHDLTVREYLQKLIASHNEQVESDKQFTVGVVTVKDTNNSLYRYTNYNSTMEEIKEDLVDDLGGYLRVRHQNGVRYLDYVTLTDYGDTLDQAIRFGVNLLDFTEDMDVTDLATVVIPLGERLEESPIEALDMRLTIEEVNNGKDYVESSEGVKTYGRLVKVITWDDVTQASTLKSKAETYLSDTQWDNVQLTATAVDMHLTGDYDIPFNLGDYVRVVSDPHGLDRYFPISALTLYLDSPQNDTYTMGLSTSASLIGQLLTQADLSQQLGSLAASSSSNLSNVASDVLKEAQNYATILINAATHGYVVVEPDEILIMDTNDKETARRVWRWNLNGLGYSSTGYYGTFGTAMTMDGGIVADYVTTGTMYADRIKGGTLTLGGSNNTNGRISILSSSGAEVGTFDKDGLMTVQGAYKTIMDGGYLEFYYNNARSCYFFSDQNKSVRIQDAQRLWLGSTSENDYRGIGVINANVGIQLQISNDSNGTIGVLDQVNSQWLVSREVNNNTTYLSTGNSETIIRGSSISIAGDTDISGSLSANGVSSTNTISLTRYSRTIAMHTDSDRNRGLYDTTYGRWLISAGSDNYTYCGNASVRTYLRGNGVRINSSNGLVANVTGSVTVSTGDILLSAEDGVVSSSGTGYFTAENTYGALQLAATSSNKGLYDRDSSVWYIHRNSNYYLCVGNSTWSTILYGNGVYLNGTSTAVTSDIKLKSNVQPLSTNESTLFDLLSPKQYYVDCDPGKIHIGFVAQEVEQAMTDAGMNPDDYGLTDEFEDEGETLKAIRYEEMIALLVQEVQDLKARVKELERR